MFLTVLCRLGSRFGAGNIDGFNMMSLLLPGVAVTYNGEEIGMVNTEVSWEDTVDPAGLNCGQEHFMVRHDTHDTTLINFSAHSFPP